MSLQLAAQHMASRGRGPDTQLVHMAPQEVAGLQALAKANGGSLTINPETGLAEAGFLKKLLPTLIGAGLMFATGGTAAPLIAGLGNATTIGLGVGAATGLATGSLRKGLMAGLGAYGGAGLASAGTTAGTTAGLNAAGAEASLAGTNAGNAALAESANAVQVGGPITRSAYQPTSLGLLSEAGTGANPALSSFAAPPPVPQPVTQMPAAMQVPAAPLQLSGGMGDVAANATAPTGFAENVSAMGRGITGLGSEGGPTAFMKQMDGGMGLAKTGLLAIAPVLMDQAVSTTTALPEQGMIRPYTFSRAKNPDAFVDVPGEQMSSKQRRYFTDSYTAGTPYAAPGPEYRASGGPVQAMSDRNGAETLLANRGQRFDEGGIASLAQGGYNLGDYSDGGRLLRGPGDGVSDDIPAVIGDKRPARLADGEFVIPARVVSELGNGSTEAGARQLYSMMDRIQKARSKSIGKNKVATDSKAHKLLPA